MEEPIKALLATFLFQDLSPAEVEPLAARTTTLSLRSGQFLHRAGDPAGEVWVLTSGQLKAWMPSEGGEEFVFDVLVPPQLMGLPGVFAQARTRLINTVATQESSLITVPATALRETMRTHPAVTWRALERLAEIARSYSDALLDVAYSNV
ncbi:MAG: cyclic nucleotide-binding domain-containing protein, partial [Candidatus Eremiobacteraeota bacterium]|nr:cyclic nucleotide-binding domain-containing protein [Candidatus Eremiobacteraeota bacterium]